MKTYKKLWKLLEDAVADALAFKRRKNCGLYMDTWMDTGGNGVCTACLAGSMLIRRFDIPHARHVETAADFDRIGVTGEIAKYARAINYLRAGYINSAAEVFGISERWRIPLKDIITVASHSTDEKAFFKDMKKLVAILKACDL